MSLGNPNTALLVTNTQIRWKVHSSLDNQQTCAWLAQDGMVSPVLDAYSFGVVLLELLSGQRAVSHRMKDDKNEKQKSPRGQKSPMGASTSGKASSKPASSVGVSNKVIKHVMGEGECMEKNGDSSESDDDDDSDDDSVDSDHEYQPDSDSDDDDDGGDDDGDDSDDEYQPDSDSD